MSPPAVVVELLPSGKDVKAYLRIETDAEDVLLQQLAEEAIGTLEQKVGRCLRVESVSWVDLAISYRLYDAPPSLILRDNVDPATVVVADKDGNVVDPSNYSIDNVRGLIRGKNMGGSWPQAFTFNNGPYTISATAGLGTRTDYNTRWLPAIRRTAIDLAAFWYQQRTPGASSESSAGTRVDYGEIDKDTGFPTRVLAGIRSLRGVTVSRL